MIRNEAEYNETLHNIEQLREAEKIHQQTLLNKGFNEDEVKRLLDPAVTFRSQLEDQIVWYEDARAGRFEQITGLQNVGRLLIAARIASGNSQRQLASLLGVHEAAVSRDERNEYRGITLQRAHKIMVALGVQVKVSATHHLKSNPGAPLACMVSGARPEASEEAGRSYQRKRKAG